MTNEGATLVVAGRGRAAAGELDLAVELPKLDFLKADLGGAAKVTSNIRFGGDRTELKLAAELSDLVRGQIASQKLTLSATGSIDAAGRPMARSRQAAILQVSRCRSTGASRSMRRAA